MDPMHDRFKPPILITIMASLLLLASPFLLRATDPELAGAAIVLLAMLGGAGIAFGLDVHPPQRRRH